MFSISYPVPKIVLYPIFIFIVGLGSSSKVALVFLECAYPITVNAYFGIRGVDMGTGRLGLFWKVALPAAAPDIFAGIRIALPVAFIVVIFAEMIGESVGLGYCISLNLHRLTMPRYRCCHHGFFAGSIVGSAAYTLDLLGTFWSCRSLSACGVRHICKVAWSASTEHLDFCAVHRQTAVT